MRFSMQAIHSSGPFAQSHLWSVEFPNDPDMNALKSGGDIGQSVPCIDVVEPVYTLDYDELKFQDNLTLHLPKTLMFHGRLKLELYDKDTYTINKFLLQWAMRLMEGASVDLLRMEKEAKRVVVHRYTRESGKPIFSNAYWVLPPPEQIFHGEADPDLTKNSIELVVVKTEAKMGV